MMLKVLRTQLDVPDVLVFLVECLLLLTYPSLQMKECSELEDVSYMIYNSICVKLYCTHPSSALDNFWSMTIV